MSHKNGRGPGYFLEQSAPGQRQKYRSFHELVGSEFVPALGVCYDFQMIRVSKMAWFAVLTGIMILQPRGAQVSDISFIPTPLWVMVNDAPIIVIARLTRPEPESREVVANVTNPAGELETFSYRGEVWYFTIIEVLKASSASPSGEIEVISSTQTKYYRMTHQYHETGYATRRAFSTDPVRLSFTANMTEYVGHVSELGDRDAVLFLKPPMEAKYYAHEPYFKVFGLAYPLAADPGLDDPELTETIREYIRQPPYR